MRKKIYFTSDWHVGHENVLKFDQRPFKNLEEMHEELIKRFNHFVPKHGLIYFAGDMGWNHNGLLKSVIDRLNGTKVLVRGNHDGNFNAMYSAGFDVVIDKAQLVIQNSIVTITHCPLQGIFREDVSGMSGALPNENWHKETKHKNKYSINDFGQFHLHGHIHARKGNGKKVIDGRQMDIGVAAWDYRPVRFEEVESWICKYKKDNLCIL